MHDDYRTAVPVMQGDRSARWLRQLPSLPSLGTSERAGLPTTCSARLRMDRQRRHRWILIGINVIAIALMLCVTDQFTISTPKHVSSSEFLTELRAAQLSDVQIPEAS